MIVRYRVRALRDIDGIFGYLNERSPPGARNVVEAIDRAILAITLQPYASQSADQFNARAKVVGRYPYKIFYRVLEDGIVEILHVRHTSRQPWSGVRD